MSGPEVDFVPSPPGGEDPLGWAGPYGQGDEVYVFTGPISDTSAPSVRGTIGSLTSGGLSLVRGGSYPTLWMPRTGITAIARREP